MPGIVLIIYPAYNVTSVGGGSFYPGYEIFSTKNISISPLFFASTFPL
jgi:hypothetical protein